MGSHILIEYITPSEVEHTTVILILRNKPVDVKSYISGLFGFTLNTLNILIISFIKRDISLNISPCNIPIKRNKASTVQNRTFKCISIYSVTQFNYCNFSNS